jgi:Putative MetA-pathway of phenol degradation
MKDKLGFLCVASALLLALTPLDGDAKIVRTKSKNRLSREVTISNRIEHETGETVVPLLIEWSPTDKLALSIEPSYASVTLDNGTKVSGMQDLDAGLVYEIARETRHRPSVALEFDVKLPTASNPELGTKKADFSLGVVLGKEYVHHSLEASALYTFVGKPPGVKQQNVFELSVSGEWRLTPRIDLLGELVGSTGGSLGGNSRTGFGLGGVQSALTLNSGTEGELTLGVAEHFGKHFKLEQGVTGKTEGTIILVVGWEYDFGSGK